MRVSATSWTELAANPIEEWRR